MIMRHLPVFALLLLSLLNTPLLGQDDCNQVTVNYHDSGFDPSDFLRPDAGVVIGDDVTLNTNQELDTDNLLLGLDQPFLVDFISEGAGANHMFGFFFLDIDTNKDGLPDFFQVGDDDDLDGDGLINSLDDDDDNDGILDVDDRQPPGVNSVAAEMFRNGPEAAAAGLHAGDYWQFVPNSLSSDPDYTGTFEHPGAHLYVDNHSRTTLNVPNGIPDMLETPDRNNSEGFIPPYAVDRGYLGRSVSQVVQRGFLGHFDYAGTPAGSLGGTSHWTGATIFYLADDDGPDGVSHHYANHTPYTDKNIQDGSSATDSLLDYNLYGSNNFNDSTAPDLVRNPDGTPKTAPNGQEYWRFRWYQSNVSGARELVFFLTVFYNGGVNTNNDNVNTYYSKSSFNPDTVRMNNIHPTSEKTTGDAYGETGFNNWYPYYPYNSPPPSRANDHDQLAAARFGAGTVWTDIATSPGGGSAPVAVNPANQAWVDEWANLEQSRVILQYRALRDWFDEANFDDPTVDANDIIDGRYGIDMNAENDSSLIRAINGRMVHLMVGAPEGSQDAWLLGWEDLFGGGDRDYEDVVFYVKREAGGILQSHNVAAESADLFDDFTITQVSFDFTDNFTSNNWNIPGRYISYSYSYDGNTWIPLLGTETPGNEHIPEIDRFQPSHGGSTVPGTGRVRRQVTIEIPVRTTEIYWRMEMATDNVDLFTPVLYEAEVGYQTLPHDFFYNAAVVTSSNMRYVPALETPSHDWDDRFRNRGHLYAQRWFNHGPVPTPLTYTVNPESTPESAPSDPNILWDAGITMRDRLGSHERLIYTALPAGGDPDFTNNMIRYQLQRDATDAAVVNAYEFQDMQIDGFWIHNFHDPAAPVPDHASSGLWLQNWLHGYRDVTISAGSVSIEGPTRDWILGGINRSAVDVVREPGLPAWIDGNDVPAELKRSYFEYLTSSSRNTDRTRLLVGAESGLVHCIDAGEWRPTVRTTGDAPADGHFEGDDFGTGEELWAFVPGHLLDDLKHNVARDSDVTAKVDATVHSRLIHDGSTWRRIAVIVQGYRAGREDAPSGDRTGNVVTALDVTDLTNEPIPLWQRREPNMQDIVMIPSIGWVETSDTDRVWAVAYASGATPVTGQAPSFRVLDIATGAELGLSGSVGSPAGNHVMLGSPAMIDADNNGFIDHLVGATSQGLLWVKNTKTGNDVTQAVAGARFFHTPNSRPNGDVIQLFIASSDSPFHYDEAVYGNANFVNHVYSHEYDTTTGTFSFIGSNALPPRHKVFGRPALVGDRLIVGTATGDTTSICDFDRNDPGDLLNFAASRVGQNDALVESVTDLSAPIVGALVVRDGAVEVHSNMQASSSTVDDAVAALKPPARPGQSRVMTMSGATVFGVLGWEDLLMDAITQAYPGPSAP